MPRIVPAPEKGVGILPGAATTPTKVVGLQGKIHSQQPGRLGGRGCLSSGAAAPSGVLSFPAL